MVTLCVWFRDLDAAIGQHDRGTVCAATAGLPQMLVVATTQEDSKTLKLGAPALLLTFLGKQQRFLLPDTSLEGVV
jgi:hypothetical protein